MLIHVGLFALLVAGAEVEDNYFFLNMLPLVQLPVHHVLGRTGE
jgi:hypothetical protein